MMIPYPSSSSNPINITVYEAPADIVGLAVGSTSIAAFGIGTAFLLYHHLKGSAARLAFLQEQFGTADENFFGMFGDGQVDDAFAKYGDPILDALLDISTSRISELINKELIPTYSYTRLYTSGNEMKKHIDRKSCDYSVTLCLGYDVSNVDQTKYLDYDWPMYVETDLDGNGPKGFPVHMKPGDMLIYRGTLLPHWRESFSGLNHAQAFLHYNEKTEPLKNLYDNRPLLGLPGIPPTENAE
jgi:hypothetical protein